MSVTQAMNPIMAPGEGLSQLLLSDGDVSLADAVAAARDLLFGSCTGRWPLTKVLDIGGAPVRPRFAAGSDGQEPAEAPPIPCHVHAGYVRNGHCRPPGKLEAYFFPPVDVPPYSTRMTGISTRLGFKPDTTRAQVIHCLRRFAADDRCALAAVAAVAVATEHGAMRRRPAQGGVPATRSPTACTRC